jgi:hypothetical protein
MHQKSFAFGGTDPLSRLIFSTNNQMNTEAEIVKEAKLLPHNYPKLVELLYYAVCHGYLDACQLLVKGLGANVNNPTPTNSHRHRSMLHAAVETEHLEVARYLISQGAFFSLSKRFSYDLIQVAALCNKTTLLEILGQTQGYDFNPMICRYPSALQLACREGHLDAVKWLVEHGADINYCDHNERAESSPLKDAVRWDQPKVLEYLLTQGVDLDSGGRRVYTAIQEACGLYPEEFRGDLELVTLLVRHGARLPQYEDKENEEEISNPAIALYMSNVPLMHSILVLCWVRDFEVGILQKLPKELIRLVFQLFVRKE